MYILGAFKEQVRRRISSSERKPEKPEQLTETLRKLNDCKPVKESELPSSFVNHCLYSSMFDPNNAPLVNAENFEANYHGRWFRVNENFFFYMEKGVVHVSPRERFEYLNGKEGITIPISKVTL